MPYKAIAQLAPTMQSLALLASTVPKKNKKFKPVKTAVGIIVGTELIRATSANVASL